MLVKLGGLGIGYMIGTQIDIAIVPYITALLGYQIFSLGDDKEIDGEKKISTYPPDNGSYPNLKKLHGNSIKWTKATYLLKKYTKKKKDVYINSFKYMDTSFDSYFSVLGGLIKNWIETIKLGINWEDFKKGSLIVGAMGQGKTIFYINIITQFAKTNRRMIIHDTKGEYTELFYRENKDFIINHLDGRGAYWDFYIDNDRGLAVSLVLDFFHAYFIAVAGDVADKYWSTMAAKRFEEYFNEIKINNEVAIDDKMEYFLITILEYFTIVKESSNKTEQSIVATLEASLDIFLKMLFMKKKHQKGEGDYKLFLFSDYFDKENDSRIFLHSIEEVSRVNTPFISAFISILYRIQLSITNPAPSSYILYALDEYLTFYSLLSQDLKKSLHTKSRSTGALLLPGIQYLPRNEDDRKNLLSSIENLYYFAVTDPDTKKTFNNFIGQVRFSRSNKRNKEKTEFREEKIELIDDNIINTLPVGHHIAFYPKSNAALYVGYTLYEKLPKIADGYIRQGTRVENEFIIFKNTLPLDKS